VNLDNKKIYVGQTKNFDVRMGSHFNKSGQKSYIKRAIEKHGRERFVSVILLAGIEKQEEHINPGLFLWTSKARIWGTLLCHIFSFFGRT
jgi:group I intron endonuclease